MEEKFNVVTEEDIERFERLNKGVVIFDEGGEIAYANPFALGLLGCASVEDAGNIWRFISPEYGDLVKKRCENAVKGERNPPLVLKIFTADRRIELIKSRTQPVIYRGKKTHHVGFHEGDRGQDEKDLHKEHPRYGEERRRARSGG